MAPVDARPSVLLIEDELLISLDLCETLHDAGFDVVGPANTLQGALFLLDREKPQAAIIDLLLRDGTCAPLVERLHQSGVPFVVHSGTLKEDDLVALCRGAPWISKPSASDDLIRALGRLLHPGVAA